MARNVIIPRDMRPELPTIDLVELRQVTGGAAREQRRANVASAMQALQSSGSVSKWLSGALKDKHGGVTCACGCGLANCQ